MLSHCSEEFKNLFSRADIVISKGQGNLESLLHYPTKKKCHIIADILSVKKGEFVVTQNRFKNESRYSEWQRRDGKNLYFD